MKTSYICVLAIVLAVALCSEALIPLYLHDPLVQTGIGLGAQIGGGLVTLAALGLTAKKWEAEKTFRVPVPVAIAEPSHKGSSGGLGGLGLSLGSMKGLGSGLSLGSLSGGLGGSLGKLGRRRRR